MKKFLLPIFLISFLCGYAQQAIKPTIMVVPDKKWCIKNGYVKEDGKTVDYRKALMNSELNGSIIEMNNFMAEIGYPMESLEKRLDNLDEEEAIDLVGTSRGDSDISEDDLDKLLRNANADFMVSLALDYKPYGPRKIVEFQLEAIDAASGKSIGGATGNSTPSNAPANNLVREAVSSFMDNFVHKLDLSFADMSQNGREGSLVFKIADDCPYNMESIIEIPSLGEGELRDYIEYWLTENTVDGAPRADGSSRVRAAFNQVRFPLYGTTKSGFGDKTKVKPITAEKFVKDIEPSLRALGISTRVIPMGVGKATIILGSR